MCHQSVGLASRHLENEGIPTVVIGSGRDIVEECGVARFLFVDFPLGNPCGKPYDTEMQAQIADLAMDVLEKSFVPRTTVQAPVVWDAEDDAGWRARFMHVGDDNRAKLAADGEERRKVQEEIRAADAAAAREAG